jgi:hypothetical protein
MRNEKRRFCQHPTVVEIEEVLTRKEAAEVGYTKPTHYDDDPSFAVYGKMIGKNRMQFAAVIK